MFVVCPTGRLVNHGKKNKEEKRRAKEIRGSGRERQKERAREGREREGVNNNNINNISLQLLTSPCDYGAPQGHDLQPTAGTPLT